MVVAFYFRLHLAYFPRPVVAIFARPEHAKQIRKDYERGIVKERRCNMRQYSVRTDDCTNTISTVQKDNYLLEWNDERA